LIRRSPDGTLTPITRGTAIADSPNVSPDGSRLAYVLDTDRKSALIVEGFVPGGSRVRIPCGGYCTGTTWSPDGRRIAFGRLDLTGFHVVVVNADGSGERTYMQTHPSRDAADAIEWFSDHELVYATMGNGPLDLFDLATGIEQPLLREPTTGWMFSPRRSPDGRYLAFFWNRGANPTRGIYLAERDGSARLVIAEHRFPVAWAPDGKSLLIAARDETASYSSRVERAHLGGSIEALWTTPDGMLLDDVVPIHGSDDVILVQRQETSDAWLMER